MFWVKGWVYVETIVIAGIKILSSTMFIEDFTSLDLLCNMRLTPAVNNVCILVALSVGVGLVGVVWLIDLVI